MKNNCTTIPDPLSLELINDEKQLLKRSLYAYASQLKARDDFQELYRVRRMLRKLNELKLPR